MKGSVMLRKMLSCLIVFTLILQQTGFLQAATVELNLPLHLARMSSNIIQDKFRPLHLRYFSYDALSDNFELLLDKGDLKGLKDEQIKEQGQELLKYFLVGITLPDEKFWVNLRPDSEDQIIDLELASTDLGKVLLEADLQLKKDTALFTSPETAEGRAYWDKLYQRAGQLFGSDNITIPTLTRPWIVPQEVIIRETADSAYVYKATLKVMLEQDHLTSSTGKTSLTSQTDYSFKDPRLKELNEYSSQLIRENIIPKLTKQVNTSKKYASLRQVFYSLILSRWFKSRFAGKSGLYPELINQHNLTGLTSQEPWSKTTYFNAYKKSFTDGEYNLKEQVYTPTSAYGGGQVIRSYFSGGVDGRFIMPTGGAAASPLGRFRGGNPEVDYTLKRHRNMADIQGRPRGERHLPDLRLARPRTTSSPLEAGDMGSLKIMPGTSIWVFAPSGNIPEDLRRLKAEADEQTGEAFVKDRAFEFIPGQISFSAEGKPDSATQKRITALISGWKKTRAQDENLNQVLPDEEKALTKDIINSLRFIKQTISGIQDPIVRARLETETRFVFTVPAARPNTEQVELMEKELGISPPVLHFYGPSIDASGKITSLYYGEEAPGISSEDGKSEVVVLGFGGRHLYKDSEAKTYAKAPSSMYIPLSRVKRYAQLLDEAKTTGNQENGQRIITGFKSWLISTHLQISTNDTTISEEDEQNILFTERLAYEHFKKERQTYLELLARTHQNRTREYKLDVELLHWLNVESIPAELEDVVTQVLSNAKDHGEIVDFLVTRTGDDLSIWISHKKSTQDNLIPQIAKNAVLASLAKAKEMGIFKAPAGEPDVSVAGINKDDFNKGLRWRAGNVVYTIREGAHPTLRVKYFGGSRKALDLGMEDLYANIAKTTMGTIEGIPGWYYVSQKIEDLRQGNPEVQGTMLRYPNDTDHLASELRDENWAFSAIFPGKQSKVRMDEPAAFVFLDSNYVEDEDQVANPDLRPFSPWIWVAQHSGYEAKGATEGVLLGLQIISGPDTYRAIQTMKVGEAAQATWAKIKDEPVAVAIGIESHMKADGGYDNLDLVDMLGRSTEYQDLQRGRDRQVDFLKRQGPFQYGLTTRFADLQGDRTWEELEAQARGASSPLVNKIGNVKLGVPEALPDRKKGELPEHWDFTRKHQLFTGTIKKGDIGGEGHGSPYPTYEPSVEAHFREVAQRKGTHLKDFITFAIGDDLQFLMLHQRGPLRDEIGQYAWEGFWRAGWGAKALAGQPYAFMQDAPGAKDKNVRDEAQLNATYMKELEAELRTWAQEPGVQAYLKLNHLDVEEVIRQLLAEYQNPQRVKPKATGGVVQLAGNLIGSGFGNADLVVTPWLYEKTKGKFMAFGYDKTSPAVYNAIVLGAARKAIARGEFENIYIDVQNVHTDRHVLYGVKNSLDKLQKLLSNSSRYQIGDIFTNDEEGNLHQLGAFTTDRLFQVLFALTGKFAYGGKDDPESLVAWSFGKYMIEVVRETKFYQVLGNERGSNIRMVRWTPVKRPYLGQFSDPTAAALLFSVDRNGKIIPQSDGSKYADLFDTPEFATLRQEIKDTQAFIKASQGTIGPGTAADLTLLELAYPAVTIRLNLLADPARRWSIRTGEVIARQHNPATAAASSPVENGPALQQIISQIPESLLKKRPYLKKIVEDSETAIAAGDNDKILESLDAIFKFLGDITAAGNVEWDYKTKRWVDSRSLEWDYDSRTWGGKAEFTLDEIGHIQNLVYNVIPEIVKTIREKSTATSASSAVKNTETQLDYGEIVIKIGKEIGGEGAAITLSFKDDPSGRAINSGIPLPQMYRESDVHAVARLIRWALEQKNISIMQGDYSTLAGLPQELAKQFNDLAGSASSPVENGKYVRTLKFLNWGEKPVGLLEFLLQKQGNLEVFGQVLKGKFQPSQGVTVGLLLSDMKSYDRPIEVAPESFDKVQISPGASLVLTQDLLKLTGAAAVPGENAFPGLLTFEKRLPSNVLSNSELTEDLREKMEKDTGRKLGAQALKQFARAVPGLYNNYEDGDISIVSEEGGITITNNRLGWVRQVVLVGNEQQITLRVGVRADQLKFLPGHFDGLEEQLQRAIETAIEVYRDVHRKDEAALETARQAVADTASLAQGESVDASSPVMRTFRDADGFPYTVEVPTDDELAIHRARDYRDLKAYIGHSDPNLDYAARRKLEQLDRENSVSSPVVQDDKAGVGGIDFRVIPIITQPMGNLSGLSFSLPKLSNLESINLDAEFSQIQNMLQAGITPSGERLKEYVAACYQKGELKEHLEGIVASLVDICKLEEEKVDATSDATKEVLLILEVIS